MSSSPSCIVGGISAVIYLGFAIYVVASERTGSGGGWITLNGMGAFIVTFPISAPLELLGVHLDHRRIIDMSLAIAGTAGLVYLTAAGITSLFRFD